MARAIRSLYVSIILNIALMSLALAQGENQFVYHGFTESKLHLDGTAKILPSGVLQLTNNDSLRSGQAFYPSPFKFNTSSSQALSFSTNFVFAMKSHGIAFLISPSMDFSKAVPGAYLGVFNFSSNGLSTNHILAVELDAVQTPEFDDIYGGHVGIDIISLISNESAPPTYFSDIEEVNESLNLAEGPTQMWIDYNGAEKLLNVTLAPIEILKPSWPLLSKHVDLSRIILDIMYVGFSAATDTIKNTSPSIILGWSFNMNGQAQNLDINQLPSIPRQFYFLKELDDDEKFDFTFVVYFIVLLVMLITISGAVYIVMKKKYEEVYEDWEREYGPQRLSYINLYKATKGFSEKELIGKGGFGKVYRGVLPTSNDEIAVKRISHGSKQGMKEFVAEIATIGRLRHRNLVQLRGYCRRRGEFLLAYDYMPNGSLDKILYSKTKPNLNWFQRFQIIRGIASSLLYLHEEWEQVILHRDIKPGNVLLDADLNGKLGDFGLARLHDRGSNPESTKLVGTFGYLAPELMRTGKATTSTDVYGFGIFMLEVACGRRPLEQQGFLEGGNLVSWVADHWKRGSILDASDPRLEGVYAEDQMELILKLGLFCSHPNPAGRPSMRQVMQYLDGDVMLPNIPSDSALIGLRASNDEALQIEMSFPSDLGNGSVIASESILAVGR